MPRDPLESIRRRAVKEALEGRASTNGDGHKEAPREPEGPPAWEEPIPLTSDYATPDFPTSLLPDRLARWVQAEAEATQTPPDLAGCLALAIAGAALAGKFRVIIRDNWNEPLNLFTVVSLPPGDRKSAVFADALAPVQRVKAQEQERMGPVIAELASAHRVLENQLKVAEARAAKAEDPAEAGRYREEAKQLAREFAAHQVPDPPQFWCDDVPPEKLAKLLARQGGRTLQASPEGTAFEIVKGHYSETANFEVYLKGHAGDALRVDRISRAQDSVDRPALSLALAVQPDVIQGLADQTSLRGRGFLARFLYSIPVSRVGRRSVAPAPVSNQVTKTYWALVTTLWELPGSTDETGKPAPNWLRFSPAADRALQAFEVWLEPQLAEGEDLVALDQREPGIIGIQVTTVGHMADRLRKIQARPELALWLRCGGRAWVVGWAKRGGRWQVKIVAVRAGDLEAVPLTPARRRRGRQPVQGQLFD